jgi:PiT family inorganic phosphate transporter
LSEQILPEDWQMLIALNALALIYAFLNGYRDSPSILAALIASRAINPRIALYLIAVADLIAPFLFSLSAACSIGTGLINVTSPNPAIRSPGS